MNNLSNREDFNKNKDLYKFTLNDHINNLADLVDRMSGFIDHYKNTVGFDGYENEVEELLEDSKNELDRFCDYQNIIEASASKVALYDDQKNENDREGVVIPAERSCVREAEKPKKCEKEFEM